MMRRHGDRHGLGERDLGSRNAEAPERHAGGRRMLIENGLADGVDFATSTRCPRP